MNTPIRMPDTAKQAQSMGAGFISEETAFRTLTRIGQVLGVPVDRAGIQTPEAIGPDPLQPLSVSARYAGIFLKETRFDSVDEPIGFVDEGYPIVIAGGDGRFFVLEKTVGRKIEVSVIADRVTSQTISGGELGKLLGGEPPPRVFVAKKELECDSISSAPGRDGHGHHHEHPTPVRRFLGLLDLDRRDIGTVALFALVAGILALATPLAIESLVNVVSWGTYIQPLIVLGLILLTCLGLAGVLKVLQTVVVEIIQRRQFVRIVSDLAHRFPRANQAFLIDQYPRELANRVFDIMTIQKATAVLLLDGTTIVLTTILGMVLLAFYHPFLLGFDIVLLISMISITWILGRGGIRTAIEESITKYQVAHWLQDVLASPTVFKIGGGESLAIQRANQLTSEYINARKRQFRVVIRQVAFAIALQAIASTALLALGGWLVIQGQLTLGQLVASELVVTVVVGAFAKAGKSLEKFYDLMAGIDKVGHLIDIPADPRHEVGDVPDGPVEACWGDLVFHDAATKSKVPSASVQAGSRIAIVGDDVTGRSLLAKALAGLAQPSQGLVQVAGYDSEHASTGGAGWLVSYAGGREVFHGTLRDNVDLGRNGIGQNRVRDVLQQVGLAATVLQLSDGLQTPLQTAGYPLSSSQVAQLILARSIVTQPKLLVIDGLLDELDSENRSMIWKTLVANDAPWTLIVVTNRDDIASECDSRITIRKA